MVKFESVVKNIDDSIATNGIFFVLGKNKINYIYSENKVQLFDIFNIITGFYKPSIGGLIYDDYDLNQFSLSDKAYFIRKNIAIVTPFNSVDNNMTVLEYLKLHAICVYENKQDQISIINQLIKEFDLSFFLKTKILTLSNKLLIKLMLASVKITNPKYLYFFGIQHYISTIDSYNFFVDLLSQHFLLSDITVTLFVNQLPIIKSNSKSISSEIINLDNLNTINSELLIRNKKIEHHKNFSGNFLKIFYSIFKQKFLLNLVNILIFILLGIVFSISLGFLAENKNNKNFILGVLCLISIIDFIFSIYLALNIYKNIQSQLFLITRWGLNIIECLWILFFLIIIVSFIYCSLWLLPLLIWQFVFGVQISWAISLIFLLFLLTLFALTLILSFIFNNKKMIKRYDENW